MKKHIIILAITFFISFVLKAQIKLSGTMAKSALNSNVTKTIVVTSVNQTQSSYGSNVMATTTGNFSAAYEGVTNSGVLANLVNPISSRFGYYSPFYAEIITVNVYGNYFRNVPIIKYLPPYGEYYAQDARVAKSIMDRIWPAYKYFLDNKPGYVPYLYERPASISIDVGVTKPVPLQVDPSNQAYWLYNTRFVRTFSLTY